MTENDISKIIVQLAFEIHSELGPGLLESVYEKILIFELKAMGFQVESQKHVQVFWKGVNMDFGFRPDLIVDEKVIIEIKSVENVAPVHYKQLLTYLKVMDLKLGLLINFNESLIKNGIKRVVNNL
jgi:GxxExxY protein